MSVRFSRHQCLPPISPKEQLRLLAQAAPLTPDVFERIQELRTGNGGGHGKRGRAEFSSLVPVAFLVGELAASPFLVPFLVGELAASPFLVPFLVQGLKN